ncbi:DUF4384 domain-containing protein [Rhodospira trueperi]|uniref:Uncharacterized protein n=1 Tax=Rhodospira trueperi TaxID=69960 RepID=A0A1G7ASW8_9PROT|nr:DUF4384 domain-containing protein [Rhodospira trueperi]SDE17994.1 protein of unknown function [Rhodospira trueperi]
MTAGVASRGLGWGLAGFGSLVLHALVLLIVATALAPDPVPEQPSASARLRMTTEAVRTDQAEAADAVGEAAPEAVAERRAVAQGAVRTQRAGAVAAPSATAAEAAPPAQPLAASVVPDGAAPAPVPATAMATRPVAPPAGDPVAAASMDGARLSARPADAAPVFAAPPSLADAAAPVSDPAAESLAPSSAAGAVAAPVREAPATPVAPGDPGALAQVATATLGWSGDADETLGPASLAAIQTYMGPSPGGKARESVRDSLGAAFDSVPCSRLQANLIPETGALEIRGHVPDPALRETVEHRIAAVVGGSLPVRTNLLVLPQPQCGVLRAMDAMPMPQSRDQIDDPLTVGREAQAGLARFRDGDILRLDLEAPDFDAWLHIDYFDAAGQVIHLMPSRFAPARRVSAEAVFTFGQDGGGGSGPVMEFVPPFGREIAVVFGTSRPVLEEPRPLVEEAGPYLDWLRGRLRDLTAGDPGFQAEWAYLLVETRPR